MSRASDSRRLAIRLVDALKREGHGCTIEIDEQGMPQIFVAHCPTIHSVTIEFDFPIGTPAGNKGEQA